MLGHWPGSRVTALLPCPAVMSTPPERLCLPRFPDCEPPKNYSRAVKIRVRAKNPRSWARNARLATLAATVPDRDGGGNAGNFLKKLARPERFELPTYCSGGNRSIQLSYGRGLLSRLFVTRCRDLINSQLGSKWAIWGPITGF